MKPRRGKEQSLRSRRSKTLAHQDKLKQMRGEPDFHLLPPVRIEEASKVIAGCLHNHLNNGTHKMRLQLMNLLKTNVARYSEELRHQICQKLIQENIIDVAIKDFEGQLVNLLESLLPVVGFDMNDPEDVLESYDDKYYAKVKSNGETIVLEKPVQSSIVINSDSDEWEDDEGDDQMEASGLSHDLDVIPKLGRHASGGTKMTGERMPEVLAPTNDPACLNTAQDDIQRNDEFASHVAGLKPAMPTERSTKELVLDSTPRALRPNIFATSPHKELPSSLESSQKPLVLRVISSSNEVLSTDKAVWALSRLHRHDSLEESVTTRQVLLDASRKRKLDPLEELLLRNESIMDPLQRQVAPNSSDFKNTRSSRKQMRRESKDRKIEHRSIRSQCRNPTRAEIKRTLRGGGRAQSSAVMKPRSNSDNTVAAEAGTPPMSNPLTTPNHVQADTILDVFPTTNFIHQQGTRQQSTLTASNLLKLARYMEKQSICIAETPNNQNANVEEDNGLIMLKYY